MKRIYTCSKGPQMLLQKFTTWQCYLLCSSTINPISVVIIIIIIIIIIFNYFLSAIIQRVRRHLSEYLFDLYSNVIGHGWIQGSSCFCLRRDRFYRRQEILKSWNDYTTAGNDTTNDLDIDRQQLLLHACCDSLLPCLFYSRDKGPETQTFMSPVWYIACVIANSISIITAVKHLRS